MLWRFQLMLLLSSCIQGGCPRRQGEEPPGWEPTATSCAALCRAVCHATAHTADSHHRLSPGSPELLGSAGPRAASADESSSKATWRFKQNWVKRSRNRGVRKIKSSP